jgi:hypothetical protein
MAALSRRAGRRGALGRRSSLALVTAAPASPMLRRTRWFDFAATSNVGGRGTGVGIPIRIARKISSAGRRNTAGRPASFTVLAAAGATTGSTSVSRLGVRYEET